MMNNAMTAHIFTDGAARSNPKGPASIGMWVNERGRASYGEGSFLGVGISNNVAEYRALLRGLEEAHVLLAKHDIDEVVVHLDSDLAVKQVSGEYACRKDDLQPLLRDVRASIARAAHGSIRLVHVLRGANSLADRMANEAIDARDKVVSCIDVDVVVVVGGKTKHARK